MFKNKKLPALAAAADFNLIYFLKMYKYIYETKKDTMPLNPSFHVKNVENYGKAAPCAESSKNTHRILPIYTRCKAKRGIVKSFSISWMTEEELKSIAVCEITEPTLYKGDDPEIKGLYDPRLGPIDYVYKCSTCDGTVDTCTGHIGYIKLRLPVYHVKALPDILYYLQSFCHSCSRLLIPPEHPIRKKLMLIDNQHKRLAQFAKYSQKFSHCGNAPSEDEKFNIEEYLKESSKEGKTIKGCGSKQRMYEIKGVIIDCYEKKEVKKTKKSVSFSTTTSTKTISDKDADIDDDVEMAIDGDVDIEPDVVDDEEKSDATMISKVSNATSATMSSLVKASSKTSNKRRGKKVTFTVLNALSILKRIRKEDYLIFGKSPPHAMIVQSLAVPPNRTRINSIGGYAAKNRSETDLTKHLKRIAQINNILGEKMSHVPEDESYLNYPSVVEAHNNLQVAHAAYICNTGHGMPKVTGHTKAPLRYLIQQWTGKTGRIRGHLCGKRFDFSARTVISPSIDADIDQLYVPKRVCMKLTYPEYVTMYNIHEIRKMVQRGPDNYPGALTIIKKNGELIDLRYAKNYRADNIEIGMKVERHLKDGDIVTLNRQPSLHKSSIMSYRVIVHDGNTFKVNLAVTGPYNADFDGDEMNLHVPQNLESRAEAAYLMKPHLQINDAQDKACIGLKQDSQIGAYCCTSKNILHERGDVIHFANQMTYHSLSALPIPAVFVKDRFVDSGYQVLWTGKQCASMTLPKINKSIAPSTSPSARITSVSFIRGVNDIANVLKDTAIVIDRGDIIVGRLDKSMVGASRGGLVQNIVHDFGFEIARQFISDSQRYFNYWISKHGFGMSIADCPRTHQQKVKELTNRVIEFLKTWSHEIPIVEEEGIKRMIEIYKNQVGVLIQKQAPGYVNRYLEIIAAGAKGTVVNYCQTNGVLSQQYIGQTRLEPSFTGRVFPHYFPGDKDPRAQGFIDTNYMYGISPLAMYMHTMAGREGLVDTSTKTAEVGHLNRWLMRAMEDIKICQDKIVRDGDYILTFCYGGNGFDASFIETQQYPCVNMSVDEMKKKYSYNRPLSADEAEEIQNIITDSHILRQVKLNFETHRIDIDIKSPVAFARILNHARREMLEHLGREGKGLTVDKVIKSVNELIKFCEGQVNNKDALLAFRALLRINLCSKNIIDNLKLDQAAFDKVIQQIKDKFIDSLVQPGEMVGNIAGQSIGEPCLQMTLNTFHHAGVGNKNMSSAFHKIKETIRVTNDSKKKMKSTSLEKKMKSTSLEIFLDKNHQTSDKAREIANQLGILTFSRFIVREKCQMLWDPRIFETNVPCEEDKNIVADYSIFYDEKDQASYSPILLRFVLDKNKCLIYGININQLYQNLKKKIGKDHLWMCSDYNSPVWIIRLRLSKKNGNLTKSVKSRRNKPKNVEETKSGDASEENLKDIGSDAELVTNWQVFNVILNTIVHGVNGITSSMIQKQKHISYNPVDLKRSESDEFYIDTKGTNLKQVMCINGVDATRTISSNVYEIEQVLGIEAATTFIMHEIKRLFANNNSYVNQAHLHLLSNALTRSGSLVGFGDSGYHQNKYLGLLKRISFERVVKIIMNGATSGETDKMTNMVSNLIVGNAPPIGTRISSILYDDTAFRDKHLLIQRNNAILSARLMEPLKKQDINRFIPTIPVSLSPVNNMIDSSYHYEIYKMGIADKSCKYIVPEYIEKKTDFDAYIYNQNLQVEMEEEYMKQIKSSASLSWPIISSNVADFTDLNLLKLARPSTLCETDENSKDNDNDNDNIMPDISIFLADANFIQLPLKVDKLTILDLEQSAKRKLNDGNILKKAKKEYGNFKRPITNPLPISALLQLVHKGELPVK